LIQLPLSALNVLKKLKRNKSWLVLIFLVDQVIKNFLVRVNDFNDFNTGVAWGWGKDISWETLIVGLLFFLIIKFKFNFWVLMMLLGGLSNLLDRLVWGGVVDYINFFNWFDFNLADAMVFGGVIGLIYKQWVIDRYEDKKNI